MFAIDGRSLPSCNTYQEAVDVWEKAHVGPAFMSGWRGLKNKCDATKTVAMLGQTVFFRYHDTNVVTWFPDKVEIRFWDSYSTTVFCEQFLPTGLRTRMIRGEMYITSHEGVLMPKQGMLKFRRHNNQWIVDRSDIFTPTVEMLDRKKAAAIRKIVKPFMEWEAAFRRVVTPMVDRTIADRYMLIRDGINGGKIRESEYRSIAACAQPKTPFLRDAYILGRALERVPAAFGTVPNNKLVHSTAWFFV